MKETKNKYQSSFYMNPTDSFKKSNLNFDGIMYIDFKKTFNNYEKIYSNRGFDNKINSITTSKKIIYQNNLADKERESYITCNSCENTYNKFSLMIK